jgi:hypothetical protein
VARLSTQGIDRLYPPADIPGKHFSYRLSGTHGYSAAIPMATSVIEPATFRFIAQCLDQLRRRVPQASYGALLKPLKKILLIKLQYYDAFLSPNAKNTELSRSDTQDIIWKGPIRPEIQIKT